MKAKLFIISGPSGVGKTSLANEVFKNIENIENVISYATRPRRVNEVEDIDYHFISKYEFIEEIKNNFFVEWTKIYENYYGTSFYSIENRLNAGINVLLVLDAMGLKALKEKYPRSLTSIFIIPPSIKELKNRLMKRGNDNDMDLRITQAFDEMLNCNEYNYIIKNDNFEASKNELLNIIKDKIN